MLISISSGVSSIGRYVAEAAGEINQYYYDYKLHAVVDSRCINPAA
jgi:hypothetical protein